MKKVTLPAADIDLALSIARMRDARLADRPKRTCGRRHARRSACHYYRAALVGDLPWAPIDICRPMRVDAVESWRAKGATRCGVRLLAERAVSFAPLTR
jgi:leucyl aminopeptidase